MKTRSLSDAWCCSIALLLTVTLATSAMPTRVRPNIVPSLASVQVKAYKVSPNRGRPGQDYELLIISEAANCQAADELSKATLLPPLGSPIPFVETKTQAPCSITAKVRIPADAQIGVYSLWVGEKEKPPLGTIEFSIVDLPSPGSIPPGISPPAVDFMWSVMPKNVVGDNFGRAIARRFYAIEIIIGNNSTYTLQLVSVGFQLPTDNELEGLVARNAFNKQLRKTDKAIASSLQNSLLAPRVTANMPKLINPVPSPTPKRTLLPTSSYKITRGTLESKQATHLRTLVISTITALGPIFTGFTPYFHNINHRGNYTEFINIFSNPLEKGLELVWPDQRPRQRERFDDQVLRDALIVRNNTQVRTLAFFPKELLRLPKHVEADSEYNAWKDNPREVRERLGELVVIGDVVQHINRVSLTANPPPIPTPVIPPPTIVGNPESLRQGAVGGQIRITGSNLFGAQLSISGPSEIHLDTFQVDATGHLITATISVGKMVPPARYHITVTTLHGSDQVPFDVLPERIEVSQLVYEQKRAGTAATVEFELRGFYLHNAVAAFSTSGANVPSVTKQEQSPDGVTIKGTVQIPATSTAGTYKLQVTDPRNPGVVIEKDFKILPAAPPGG